MKLELTAAETSMLLTLLYWNEEDGSHFAPRAAWEQRRAGIIDKIRAELGAPPRRERGETIRATVRRETGRAK